MNLEDWFCKFDIKKMAVENCKEYLYYYEKEEPEEFNEIFTNKKQKYINFVLHSIAYVINTWQKYDSEDGTYKYISAKIRLKYKQEEFAEYEVIYGLDGKYHNDYFNLI